MEAAQYLTDFRTGAVDREPLTPEDWNARLYIANATGRPYPLNGLFWAVTDQGDAVEVAYDWQASMYLPAENGPYFTRRDGEPGCYGADEIVGWTFDCEDAEEAAALFLQVAP